MLKKSLLGTAVALSLLTASTAFAHGPQQLDGEADVWRRRLGEAPGQGPQRVVPLGVQRADRAPQRGEVVFRARGRRQDRVEPGEAHPL